MWDVMSNDYDKSMTPERCIENVIKYARPGSIIVFHDSEKSKERTLAALPGILEILKGQDYSFRAIPNSISNQFLLSDNENRLSH